MRIELYFIWSHICRFLFISSAACLRSQWLCYCNILPRDLRTPVFVELQRWLIAHSIKFMLSRIHKAFSICFQIPLQSALAHPHASTQNSWTFSNHISIVLYIFKYWTCFSLHYLLNEPTLIYLDSDPMSPPGKVFPSLTRTNWWILSSCFQSK